MFIKVTELKQTEHADWVSVRGYMMPAPETFTSSVWVLVPTEEAIRLKLGSTLVVETREARPMEEHGL